MDELHVPLATPRESEHETGEDEKGFPRFLFTFQDVSDQLTHNDRE